MFWDATAKQTWTLGQRRQVSGVAKGAPKAQALQESTDPASVAILGVERDECYY